MKLLVLAISLCAGYAATPIRQAESPTETPMLLISSECPSGEFRGSGIGNTESEALSSARSELAKQINSSIKVTAKHTITHKEFGEREYTRSDYESKTLIESALSNAHDARIEHKKHSGNKVGIVVCMSRSDAAKGFIERQRLVADSLELASSTALKTGHPKRKNDAWHKTQTLWNEFAKIQNLLDGWGIAKTSFYEPANEAYSQAKGDYKSYCQNMKIHWEDAENECSNAIFARLSKKADMEKSACSGGFRFRFACEEKCKSLSFGVECSFEPSLAIENCDGERYSLLRAAATGSDMHNKNNAMENLIDNLPKAAFFEQWEKEIKEWVPQCVD